MTPYECVDTPREIELLKYVLFFTSVNAEGGISVPKT